MTDTSITVSTKDKFISFIWQHVLLLISLFIMTFGVVLCVRSNLGSSVISSCPLAFTLAGTDGMVSPLSLGTYTNILNVLLVIGQIIILRRRFQIIQLLQLLIGFVFGAMIDLNMALTSTLVCDHITSQLITQIAGCSVMAVGIAFEMRCGSITMPGEGLPAAISKTTGKPFANVKIYIDICLVTMAVISGYLFFGRWMWNVVGIGTLFAMVYVGFMVKMISNHLGWFDRILYYRPGLRRYLYGLARYVNSKLKH